MVSLSPGFKRVGGIQGPTGQSPASQGRGPGSCGGSGSDEASPDAACPTPQTPSPPGTEPEVLGARGDEWASLRAWPRRAAGRGQDRSFLNLEAWSRPCLCWAGHGRTQGPGAGGAPSRAWGSGGSWGPTPRLEAGVSRAYPPTPRSPAASGRQGAPGATSSPGGDAGVASHAPHPGTCVAFTRPLPPACFRWDPPRNDVTRSTSVPPAATCRQALPRRSRPTAHAPRLRPPKPRAFPSASPPARPGLREWGRARRTPASPPPARGGSPSSLPAPPPSRQRRAPFPPAA